MKKLLIFIMGLFLYLPLNLPLFSLPCLASQYNETTVSCINLNGKESYDIEILLTKDEKILLPFKQLSEIFEVKVKTNHGTKEIDFETSDGKKGVVGTNSIQYDGKKISSKKNFYLKKGVMEEVKDEIFCDEKDLSVIFDSEIKTDKNDLSIIATTQRELEILKSKTENSDSESPEIIDYTKAIQPDKERNVFFESISLNNNTTSDTISQYYLSEVQKNAFFNNNSQILLKGRAYGGDLNIDLNTYNYKGELFSFGGLGFNYRKNYKGFDYELGRLRGIKEDNYTIANQALGLQISNYDKTTQDKDKKYTILGGVTGYNNKLFNTNGYIYEMNTKKFLLGGKYEHALKENLKFDSKISFDKIYSQPQNAIWQSLYSNDTLLSSGTWKNPNNLEGITNLNSIEHTINDNLKSRYVFGLSSSKDLSLGSENQYGWALKAE